MAPNLQGQEQSIDAMELDVTALYSFTVHHRAGSSNGNANALSQLPCELAFNQEKEEGDVMGAPTQGALERDAAALSPTREELEDRLQPQLQDMS